MSPQEVNPVQDQSAHPTALVGSYLAAHRQRGLPPPSYLRPDVAALPLPLTGTPLGYVISYVVRTSVGPVLIDTGYASRACWDALVAGFEALDLDLAATAGILLTHHHPDHVGLAERVRAHSGARVHIGRADDFALQHEHRGRFPEQLEAVLRRAGTPAEVREEMLANAARLATHPETLVADVLLDRVTPLTFGGSTITAVPLPGHTYGHLGFLLEQGWLCTGDTMMPEGPTQLALACSSGDRPASDLLDSLGTIRDLAPGVVLPAHQYPYLDGASRAHALLRHHETEIATVAGLAGARSAWEVAPKLTWRKAWSQMGVGTQRFSVAHTHAVMQSVSDATEAAQSPG